MKKKRCLLGAGIASIVLLIAVVLFMIKSRYDAASNNDHMENMATESYSKGDVDDVDVIMDHSSVFESE